MTRPPPLPPAFLEIPLAHRGLHGLSPGVVENTRASIRAAVDAGYGIELDLQMSRDGEAMVIHDPVLQRLAGKSGRVGDFTAAELGQTVLSGTSDTIPTLAQILDIVAGRVPLLVELKDQDGALGPDVGPLERRVVALLADYTGLAVCMSFNPHSVAALRQNAPEMVLGIASAPFEGEFWSHVPDARLEELRAIPDIARVGAGFVSHKFNDLASVHVVKAKAAGLPVLSWTIRSHEEEKIAREVADNITFEGYLARL